MSDADAAAAGHALAALHRVVAALRGPDGCPWDRRQTLETLKPYLLEETYEVLDVATGAPGPHQEELGDLLFQVVLQSQLRSDLGDFVLADVIDDITAKLVRRHPHVFGDEDGGDADQVALRWEELKKLEGKGGIEDVPRSFPALMFAEKVGKKAARVGFDWQDAAGPLDKVSEELAELKAAMASGDAKHVFSELGDLLFAVVNVARHVDVRPELALRQSSDRFVRRFLHVQQALTAQGRSFEGIADAADLDDLWDAAKTDVG